MEQRVVNANGSGGGPHSTALPLAQSSHDGGRKVEAEAGPIASTSSVTNVPIEFAPPDIAAWQWLFQQSDMLETPTMLHTKHTAEEEQYLRWKAIQFLFRVGDYMRLGNHVTCTASIYLQRFFMRRPMTRETDERTRKGETFRYHDMVPTCLYLACKVEETHRKLHAIVEATMAMLDRDPVAIQRAEANMYRADTASVEYQRWKDTILLQEERLLDALCFDMIIEQPHPLAIKACQRIGVSRDMAQLTILICNILLYGAVCTFYDAPTLAACAFLKACHFTGADPQEFLKDTRYSDRTWNEAFDVDQDEIDAALVDVERHLAYHEERISSIHPTGRRGPGDQAMTPKHTQVASAARTPLHRVGSASTPGSPYVASRSTNGAGHHAANGSEFAYGLNNPTTAGNTPVQQGQDGAASLAHDGPLATVPAITSKSADITDPPLELDHARSEKGERRAERRQTDSYRPASRHGSTRENGLSGPPPAMSNETGGAQEAPLNRYAAILSPKKAQDTYPGDTKHPLQKALTNEPNNVPKEGQTAQESNMDVDRPMPMTVDGGKSEPKDPNGSMEKANPHQEVIAAKVLHEQAEQEASVPEPAKEAISIAEAPEEGSEEEGAI